MRLGVASVLSAFDRRVSRLSLGPVASRLSRVGKQKKQTTESEGTAAVRTISIHTGYSSRRGPTLDSYLLLQEGGLRVGLRSRSVYSCFFGVFRFVWA